MASRISNSMHVALAGGAFLVSLAGAAPQKAEVPKPSVPKVAARFAPPVQLRAGGEIMGVERLYPSPVLHDMNGDGRADVVLGDLWGEITVAARVAQDGAPAWGPDAPLAARDGKDLKFSNW